MKKATVKSYTEELRKHPIYLLLLPILALAIFIRTYHIQQLAVFLSDQALMSSETLGILRGDFTLLGPKASIANFHFGPIVYYLMAPFYALFHGYPIAGTVFQTTLQILTIPLIFLLGKKIKNEKVGLIAAFLFAISALLVDYSRATFNTTTALSFSTLIIVTFFSILDRYRFWKVLIMGILLGCMVQMNYITASLLIAIAAFPLFFYRKLFTWKYFILLIVGLLIGLSPFIVFDLRHDFFNTREIFSYIFGSHGMYKKSVITVMRDVLSIISTLIYGRDVFILGLVTVLGMLVSIIFYLKNKQNNLYFTFLLFLMAVTLLVLAVYGRHLESIYLISVHTTIIVLFSALLYFILKKRTILLLLSLLVLLLLNMPKWNLQKPIHDLQDHLSMMDFEKTARIIQKDQNGRSFNVAMEAQRDNRAMPLRYFLTLYNIPVLDYEKYADAKDLYLIILRRDSNLRNFSMWEYNSFGSDHIVKTWGINNTYLMYKLEK